MTSAQPIAINYARQFGWSGRLVAMLCAEPDSSIVMLSHNFDGGHEIGRYEAALSRDEFSRAQQRLRQSGYKQIAAPSDPVPPETCFVSVGECRAGESVPTIRAFVADRLPPEIATLRDELEQGAIAEIRRHRVRVVSGQAEWQTTSFDAEKPIAVRAQFACTGPLPVTIGSPLDRSLGWSGLRLGVRNAAGVSRFLALDWRHLRPPPGAPEGPTLTLAPGETISFGIEKKVYLAPGEYEGHLMYRNVSLADDNPQFISGEVSMPLGRMLVQAPRRS